MHKPLGRLFTLMIGFSLLAFSPQSHAQNTDDDAAKLLRERSQEWTIQEGLSHKNLTIFPITTAQSDAVSYQHLDAALKQNQLRIREQGSGEVPRLEVKNNGKQPVFIMTGEIITGANQDRMSAQDVLLGPQSKRSSLSVYCVEAGRWVSQSTHFAAGGTLGTKKLRQSAAMKASQGKIWQDVAEKSQESQVHSNTGTMQAVYNSAQVQQQISGYMQTFAKLNTQHNNVIGYVAAVNGEVQQADVFASPELFAALWPKLLRALAIDAVTQADKSEERVGHADAQQFVVDGVSGTLTSIANPGLGREFIVTGLVSGSTLLHDAQVIHLALFSPERGTGPRELRNLSPARQQRGSKRSTQVRDNKTGTKGSAAPTNSQNSY